MESASVRVPLLSMVDDATIRIKHQGRHHTGGEKFSVPVARCLSHLLPQLPVAS